MKIIMMYGCQDMEPNRQLFFISVFLTQIISHRQNNADAKVALSISLCKNGICINNFQIIVFFQTFS